MYSSGLERSDRKLNGRISGEGRLTRAASNRSSEILAKGKILSGLERSDINYGFVVISPILATVSPFFIDGTPQMYNTTPAAGAWAS